MCGHSLWITPKDSATKTSNLVKIFLKRLYNPLLKDLRIIYEIE